MKKNKEQILSLLSQGFTAKEIGKKLKISNRTVEVHIYALKLIYGAKNSTHLVAMWLNEKHDNL